MLIVAVWAIPPVIAAVPLMRAGGTDYLTALFESVSGLTTTGASALETVRSVGLAGIFFRAELQWLGGFLTLVTIATVVAATGLGGLSGSQVALVSGVEDRFGRLLTTVRQILVAYSVLTVACIVLLFASGIPPFEAVCIALSTISTGGFMPIDGTFADYDNPFANGVVAVFMLIGATSIVWHRMVVEGRWQLLREHRESYWLIGIALLVSLYYIAVFADPLRAAGSSPPHWITGGFLTGISLVSTTGFEAHPGSDGGVAGRPGPPPRLHRRVRPVDRRRHKVLPGRSAADAVGAGTATPDLSPQRSGIAVRQRSLRCRNDEGDPQQPLRLPAGGCRGPDPAFGFASRLRSGNHRGDRGVLEHRAALHGRMGGLRSPGRPIPNSTVLRSWCSSSP